MNRKGRKGREGIQELKRLKEPLINSSHRRKPVSSALNFLDSGLAVTPEGGNPGRNDDLPFNQRFLN
ncbi:MAG: hypothetical protein K8H75_03415 [Sulfuricella sp.]|nr:hypothetical protein [Sulfuricella sp.]